MPQILHKIRSIIKLLNTTYGTNHNKTSWSVSLDYGLYVLFAAFSDIMYIQVHEVEKKNKPFTLLILL